MSDSRTLNPDFSKGGGLLPVIVQHFRSKQVLMLGYMNEEALEQSLETGKVTFFSRSKERLWIKGESSGHYLILKEVLQDCDADTLLVFADPQGPTCHTGQVSCFEEEESGSFVHRLQELILQRKNNPVGGSYTNSLFQKGLNKIAQKVGEEATELIIEAKDDNDALFLNEAADLMYHYLVLLAEKGHRLEDVEEVLRARHSS